MMLDAFKKRIESISARYPNVQLEVDKQDKKSIHLYIPRDLDERLERGRAERHGLTLEEWRAFRAPINAQIEARHAHKERVTREAIAAFQAGDLATYEVLLGIRQPSALQRIASKVKRQIDRLTGAASL